MDKLTIIKEWWGKKSYAEIGKLTGQTADAVRKMGRKNGLPAIKLNKQNSKLSAEKEVERDFVLDNLGRETKQTNKKYKIVQEQLKDAIATIDAYKKLEENHETTEIKSFSEESEVTPVISTGDWHLAKIIKGENVNFLNSYTPEIAKKRAEKFFVNSVRLIKLAEQSSKVNNVVVGLLGDFIEGQLREESMQNNAMLPMEELVLAHSILSAGIKYLLDNTDVKKFIFHCHTGNHARTTKKIHISTETGNSLESVLYYFLKNEFANNNRVEFVIPTGYFSYADINGYVIRFSHGWAIRYAGGIGGLFIPAFKKISQWNKAKHADLDVFQHFHQQKDGGNFICGGSLCGYDDFALSIGADFEVPQQLFFLVDHKRKQKTLTCPIFVS